MKFLSILLRTRPLHIGSLMCLLGFGATAPAAESSADHGYQALREWIAQAPAVDGLPADRVYTQADRAALEPLIPRTVWSYYFFDGLEIDVRSGNGVRRLRFETLLDRGPDYDRIRFLRIS